MILLLAATAAVPAGAETEPARVGFGTLKISGLFQAGFNYYIGDEERVTGDADLNGDGAIAPNGSESGITHAQDRATDMEFVIRRARLIFQGTVVDDRIGYFTQIGFDHDTGPELLDMRLAFSYIPYTTFSIGRFLPKFTYWQPMSKSTIYTIELPQMNQLIGIQRQTGVNVGVFHKYFELDFGAFNGRNEPNIALNPADRGGAPLGTNGQGQWNDENTAKDVYAAAAVKPIDGLRIFGGYWLGMPLDYFETKDGELVAHDAQVGIADGGAVYYSTFGLNLWAEALYQQVRFDSSPSTDPDGERPNDTFEYNALSWYAMASFNFKNQGVPFEIVGRYDYLNPDTTDDEKTHGKDDEITHITAGFNYYIESYYAMLSLNYIYKSERYDILNKKLDDTQTGIADDELLFQVQVAF
ncbi:MAG: OprO/OprP family phosphate-selective porin [Deltaproteobacteria bacterium]|nr:OprO/OprP family phosphate-selective porin [Deltaproteobacteria bacterium]